MDKRWLLGAALALTGTAASAKVVASSETGFATHNEALVSTGPRQVWAALVRPARWWNKEHTWSGSAANLTLRPAAGGCFCETLPDGGSVQHLQVIFAAPGQTLRLAGALGPLQSEAVTGTLSVTLKAEGSGTRVAFDYVVGGFMRMSMAQMAPAVDGMIGEQLSRLAALFSR